MKKQKGFTLLELTMVVAVITILSVYAVPSFKVSMVNNRLIAETTNMTSILNLARAESLRRNDYVSICPSSNGTSCSGTDYAIGAIIFTDPNNSGLSVSSKVIRVINQFPNTTDKGKGISRFTFSPTGAVNTGTMLICNPTYASYSITIGTDGSIKKTKNTGDGGC